MRFKWNLMRLKWNLKRFKGIPEESHEIPEESLEIQVESHEIQMESHEIKVESQEIQVESHEIPKLSLIINPNTMIHLIVDVEGRSQRNIKIPGRYVDSVYEDSTKSEVNGKDKVNEDVIDQSVKDDQVEKEMNGRSVNDDCSGMKCSDRNDDDVYDELGDNKINEYVNKLHKNNVNQSNNKSYADVTGENVIDFERKLVVVPTKIDDNGVEVVVFDEVMVEEDSKRWEKTVCAYFVGYGKSVNELRYNLRKMWSRYGFKDIEYSNNGVFFIKFNTDDGIEFVVNKGPWLVKNKHLIVQKWDINMCLDKTEPEIIPLWIKLCNVPLEA
ncbi:zinc knuckle CX2CX4HX4C containing protein [Tanacetum coccineum]